MRSLPRYSQVYCCFIVSCYIGDAAVVAMGKRRKCLVVASRSEEDRLRGLGLVSQSDEGPEGPEDTTYDFEDN